jgi:lipoic acid synthetase
MLNKMIRKAQWLRKKTNSISHIDTSNLLKHGSIRTMCQETACPNIADCFSKKEATFLILGDICTRDCSFCALQKGKPMPPDPKEINEIVRSIKELELLHVVITSSTRDDLDDFGARQFYDTVRAVKEIDKSIIVELLIPDMREDHNALKEVALSGADIIGHNIETVPRLYHIRKGADYERSLRVLEMLNNFNSSMITKSGIMLGERVTSR